MVNPRSPAVGDQLGDGLHQIRFTGAFYCRAELTAPWGVEFPELEGFMTLPVVLAGRCVLEIDGERHALEAGSAALITHGASHRLLSAADASSTPIFDIPVEQIGDTYEHMRFGGGGDRTQIAYAVLQVDGPLSARMLEELPGLIRVDSWDDGEAGAFQAVLRLLAREAESIQPGGEAVMTSLADVLVVQVLRSWLRTSDPAATGWLAALRDPHIGRALGRMHARIDHDWTLVELAREANMSRSAFAERFTTLVGEPPMRYLAGWRLEQAHAELTRTTETIASISSRVGYTSEASFGRAFKRHHGSTPGAVRREGAPFGIAALRPAPIR
ncbi:AraC family transcriptional regulator [Agromyces cerinus]|uniref:AraC-type DNA-binding protein n=1 Tax=Agromyces cerinus subsp. cerinus TaxID=232089 RepID=A0A1N6I7M8_9MICO|nr:AraC family transcriptional regulator [Agromyces cerinus]SIO28013.1 AraC-type DNA-binding protein [Agromyces cerinus subsp. cerinus]